MHYAAFGNNLTARDRPPDSRGHSMAREGGLESSPTRIPARPMGCTYSTLRYKNGTRLVASLRISAVHYPHRLSLSFYFLPASLTRSTRFGFTACVLPVLARVCLAHGHVPMLTRWSKSSCRTLYILRENEIV